MMKNNNKKQLIVVERRKYTPDTNKRKMIELDSVTHAKLKNIALETGYKLIELTTMFINFAIDNIEITEKKQHD